MHNQTESRSLVIRGPLQDLEVAVGIPKGRDRTPADEFLDAYRFAFFVINEINLR